VIQVFKADMRQMTQEVNGQEILTKDKAAIRINFSTQYHITDVQKALLENKDHEKQLYMLTQLALRSYVGGLTLDELLENKESVSDYIVSRLKTEISDLGIAVDHCGIKDVILPGEMKEIMNQVMIAQKQAQANTITRREETASTRSLLNTAKLMEDNQMLYKLKEMEYLERIADRIGDITVSGNGQVVDQLRQIFVK
jgi:regulator of protease activity HflC (stomatin/prohibitin superfamily)